MNALTQFILNHPETDQIDFMGMLHDAAIISDNCITTEDVAEADLDRAITYLKLELT